MGGHGDGHPVFSGYAVVATLHFVRQAAEAPFTCVDPPVTGVSRVGSPHRTSVRYSGSLW
jgi:hypothetical protein